MRARHFANPRNELIGALLPRGASHVPLYVEDESKFRAR